MREDYSDGGDAWNYFTHDQARSRAYRWGEDGIAGICDERQRLCLALALWNGADPILKERMFGLTNSEGNHGEDVKEYWFYLDSTPTHSYLKCLYKYPQRAFPYGDLVATNARRGKQDFEYELLDTGVFDDDRYFDVEVEYAKARARRHPDARHRAQPRARRGDAAPAADAVVPQHVVVGRRAAQAVAGGRRRRRARRRTPSSASGGCSADARAAVLRERDEQRAAVRRAQHVAASQGRDQRPRRRRAPARSTPTARARSARPTTCSRSPAGGVATIRVRLSAARSTSRSARLRRGVRRRAATEADALLRHGHPGRRSTRTGALVMRQALAGLLWCKQYYEYDVHRWLREHGVNPWDPNAPRTCATSPWFHMVAGDVISMPDKWEYPWFAAWDLAFHCAPLSLVDVDFAKEQVELLLQHALPCTPTGRSRPTSGTSATSTRR